MRSRKVKQSLNDLFMNNSNQQNKREFFCVKITVIRLLDIIIMLVILIILVILYV